MSSLRSQILSEIKKLLNEVGGSAEQNVVGTKDPGTEGLQKIKDQAINLMVKYKKMTYPEVQAQNPEESRILLHNLKRYLYWGNRGGAYQIQYADFMNTFQVFKRSAAFDAVCKLGNINGAYNDVIPMSGVVNKTAASSTKITICGGIVAGADGTTPQPKPPVPAPGPDGKCPDGYKAIVNEKGETNCVKGMPPGPGPGPAPGPGLKYAGCKKSQFVGKNGKTSGPEVESIQRALEVYTMERSPRGKFTYKGISDNRGTYGQATEQAVYDFQKSEGGKFATRIKTQLGSSLGNPDGCVGPKTACALVMTAGGEVAGFDLAKCKAKFGKKKIEKGVLAKGETPVKGAEDAEGLAESKNWLDKTREETSSNLFERLVKDTAKKVI